MIYWLITIFAPVRSHGLCTGSAPCEVMLKYTNGLTTCVCLMVWILAITRIGRCGNYGFSSSFLRKLIDNHSFTHQDGLYENKKWLPIKISFLHWRLLLNQILNRVMLAKRGILLNFIHVLFVEIMRKTLIIYLLFC